MRPLAKTTCVAALFLIPLWLVCSRPTPIDSELVPLPFKVQGSPEPSLNRTDLTANKAILIEAPSQDYESAAVPLTSKPADIQRMKKFSFNYGALEVQDRDAVRLKGAKVGVDFHMDGQQSVGVEGSQQIYDRQDAGAWDKDAKDESTAGIKYKLIF